mmetsp:Transcript_5587/g.11760  ORF Transcript_5587/g.11760 Transcript_5587/m.11760 type:complete len:347 (-) Transcript_5587:683-1723(-)
MNFHIASQCRKQQSVSNSNGTCSLQRTTAVDKVLRRKRNASTQPIRFLHPIKRDVLMHHVTIHCAMSEEHNLTILPTTDGYFVPNLELVHPPRDTALKHDLSGCREANAVVAWLGRCGRPLSRRAVGASWECTVVAPDVSLDTLTIFLIDNLIIRNCHDGRAVARNSRRDPKPAERLQIKNTLPHLLASNGPLFDFAAIACKNQSLHKNNRILRVHRKVVDEPTRVLIVKLGNFLERFHTVSTKVIANRPNSEAVHARRYVHNVGSNALIDLLNQNDLIILSNFHHLQQLRPAPRNHSAVRASRKPLAHGVIESSRAQSNKVHRIFTHASQGWRCTLIQPVRVENH